MPPIRTPAAIAPSQVVVDGDKVDAAPGEGVEEEGQGADKGFAFAGAHFHHFTAMEEGAAHDLHVVVAQAGGADGGFADEGKGFGHELVQGFAVFKVTAAQFFGFFAQLVVAERLHVGFEVVYGRDQWL